MSWSGKIMGRSWPFCLVYFLLLTGCGFTPLYGGGAAPQARFDTVEIGNIPDREGQYLRNALIDRFYTQGRPSSPDHTLVVAPIVESLTDLDITKNSSATRAQLRLSTTMTLLENASGKPVLTRTLTSLNSYNILASQFTTRVSEENVREAALDDLARQIETQMALYFKRN